MATIRQKIAVAEIIANRGNVMRAMRKAKYSPNSVKNPKNLTDSDGFKELFAHYGLTKELVVTSLVDDIKSKPRKREKELRLGSDILKLTKDNDKGITYNTIVFSGEQQRRIANRIVNNAESAAESHRLSDSDEPELRT